MSKRDTRDSLRANDSAAALIPTDPNDPDRPLPPRPQPPLPPRPQPPQPQPPRPPRPLPPTVPVPPRGPVDPVESERVLLFPDYFPDGMLGRLDDVIEGLGKAIVQINPAAVAAGPGVEVNNARKRVRAFLESAAFRAGRDALLGIEEQSLGVATAMLRREFGIARGEVDNIEDIRPRSGVSSLSEATINAAFKTTPTEYTIDLPVGPPIRQILPGFSGTTLTTTQRFRLSDFSELVVGGQEREFRLPLLKAECLAGQRDYRNAFKAYAALLDGSELSTARRRFVAVRAASVLVDRADQVYRSMLRLDVSKRKLARVDYTTAVQVLDDHGVPASDPDRATITKRALRGRTMLNAGFNVLGLRDSFVPVQRYSHLLNQATTAIQSCLATANAFEEDLSRAEAEVGARFDVEAERRAETTLGEVSALQVANATLTEEQVDEKIAMIEAQQDFLVLESAIAGAGKLVEAAAAAGIGTAPDTDPFAGGPGVAGFASTVANFFAQRNELQHQLAMAEIEREIAGNQTAIAELQQQLSADRLAHLERKAAFLQNKRMNAEFLFLRAAVRERRAARQLEVAIVLAYLCERALAFFLGKPDVKHIRFDYFDSEPGVVAAAEALKAEFENMQFVEEAALDQEQIGDFVERLSLVENYPLQFQRFLESDDGKMDFVYSLYQLSKDRPATHQCRLYDVAIEVKGLVPEGALRGTLSHSGRFLVRDRTATLDPATTRLEPTDEQIEQALAEQRAQGTAVAAVGGVLIYAIPEPDVLDLSQASPLLPPPPPTFTLSTFEGHAPTGLWSLQVENHRSFQITDVVLHFGIINRQSDPDELRTKVLELVDAYEAELTAGDQLDRVDGFSLRNRFPDAFFALENGAATLTFDADMFRPDLTDLQLKAVVLQAVDVEGDGLAGIEIEVRRDEFGFVRRRTTGAGGFSEDLDAPLEILEPDDRFPVLGEWQIALPQPAQFGQLGDVRLFVMYAFTET